MNRRHFLSLGIGAAMGAAHQGYANEKLRDILAPEAKMHSKTDGSNEGVAWSSFYSRDGKAHRTTSKGTMQTGPSTFVGINFCYSLPSGLVEQGRFGSPRFAGSGRRALGFRPTSA